jgi:uncharacterized repeat protein (TIGR03803 family)
MNIANVFSNTSSRITRLALPLAAVLIIAAIAVRPAQAQTETVLHSFEGSPDGTYPFGGLVLDKGKLYGMTYQGGDKMGGSVFAISPKGKDETTLYSFCSISDPDCGDGQYPNEATLIKDAKGNLYGTTGLGGAYGYGTVFEITTTGEETVLYSFCALADCVDGANPRAALILDKDGNLYGVTQNGGTGAEDSGTVFKLTPTGAETVLYSFCSEANCADGQWPYGGLARDPKGNLYGTTSIGGADNFGTVFKVAPSGEETVLHSFTRGVDGGYPWAGLIRDSKGNLYGTTQQGGTNDTGTVYEITPSGTETVIYSFGLIPDGNYPLAPLLLDKEGNLYGATVVGGTYNSGTVFEVSPSGQETMLWSFNGASDGQYPYETGLVRDAKGNLYGTTEAGGEYGYGVVFKVTP